MSIGKKRALAESTGAASSRASKRAVRTDEREPSPFDQKPRVDAVLDAARKSGLRGEKTLRIGIRVSPTLVEQAKLQTGIETNTELIEFALANIALVDDFARVFRDVGGTVDPSIELGF
jgi:hypothetical protein